MRENFRPEPFLSHWKIPLRRFSSFFTGLPQQKKFPNQFASEDRALRTENEKAQSGVSAQSAMFDLVEKSIKKVLKAQATCVKINC